MSLPLGRALRSAAGRAPAARFLGLKQHQHQSASSTSTYTSHITPPTRIRNPRAALSTAAAASAGFHTTTPTRTQTRQEKEKQGDLAPAGAGAYARTDDSITVEYPPDEQLPASKPVAGAGRAGANVFPTLATFSLQGKVGVVTGGARGLGLVMGRRLPFVMACVIDGC
jgi:hypothetical protein